MIHFRRFSSANFMLRITPVILIEMMVEITLTLYITFQNINLRVMSQIQMLQLTFIYFYVLNFCF